MQPRPCLSAELQHMLDTARRLLIRQNRAGSRPLPLQAAPHTLAVLQLHSAEHLPSMQHKMLCSRQRPPMEAASPVTSAGRQRTRAPLCKAKAAPQPPRQPDATAANPLAVGLVYIITESLRFIGIGKHQEQRIATEKPCTASVTPGDVDSIVTRITNDFGRGYFITGIIDEGVYEDNCRFEDPTIAFSGLQLWKRNLALLVPFLVAPQVVLLEPMQRLGQNEQGAEVLKAEWSLDTHVKLPWRPLVSIKGCTTYTLNTDGNKVARHVEAWSVTAAQALAQLLRPGKIQQLS